ncbi:hypothetical protein LAZ67_2002716 [Cordylochernes scorpioides]|uniref:Uncharacterized protein n=1 Tax=Cordylochernes scorpioides TaxID=51811 RepID=A0ABY6K3W9_9ARAC|nr:hypothetical protein LAZ67_2002716 [Cordylochernes scorpioides]
MVSNQLLLDALDAKMEEAKIKLNEEPIFKKMSKEAVKKLRTPKKFWDLPPPPLAPHHLGLFSFSLGLIPLLLSWPPPPGPFLLLPGRDRALDAARFQAHPAAELAARWEPTVDVPRSISWADLRRNCFSEHDADVAL